MAHFLNVEIHPHAKDVLDIMPGPQRNTSWWKRDRDLLTLLQKFRSSESTDPRDLIYALLGIASDACESTVLRPDYQISFRQLIQKAIAFMLLGDVTDDIVFSCPAWDEHTFFAARERLSQDLLVWAIENGSIQPALRLAKRNDMDHNCVVPPQRPLLCFFAGDAIYWNEMLIMVLEHSDVDVNIEDDQHNTPLSLLMRSENFALVERLSARQDVNLNTIRGFLGPPLIAAIWKSTDRNNRKFLPATGISAKYLVKRMILDRHDVDVTVRNNNGIAALDIAAARGDVDLVKVLLDKGATTEPTSGRGILQYAPLQKGGSQMSSSCFYHITQM